MNKSNVWVLYFIEAHCQNSVVGAFSTYEKAQEAESKLKETVVVGDNEYFDIQEYSLDEFEAW